jgi:putative hydrolase of the HAD superfamily
VPDVIRAVLWDLGGVIIASPFEAFAAYEREVGLPPGFIRAVNATDPHGNAWARLERAEIDPDEFASAFEVEAQALGGELSGRRVLELLAGAVRPEMVRAVRHVRAAGLRTACLTNNIAGLADEAEGSRPEVDEVMALFDVVVESSKHGIRKPERRFYDLACEQLGVRPPECVFLDDLGVNLKPAREMGMTTIKVDDPRRALAELGALLGLPLVDGPPHDESRAGPAF